jgi:hypothetical protein
VSNGESRATTNAEVVAAAQFAVKAQATTSEQKIVIALVEILAARHQVVAGMNYGCGSR